MNVRNKLITAMKGRKETITIPGKSRGKNIQPKKKIIVKINISDIKVWFTSFKIETVFTETL